MIIEERTTKPMRKLPKRTFLKRKKAPRRRSKAPSWSKLMKEADRLM